MICRFETSSRALVAAFCAAALAFLTARCRRPPAKAAVRSRTQQLGSKSTRTAATMSVGDDAKRSASDAPSLLPPSPLSLQWTHASMSGSKKWFLAHCGWRSAGEEGRLIRIDGKS